MTEKEFNELVKEYQQGLKDLEEIRAENSKRRSKMTEEEFINDYISDLNAVYEAAINNGMNIVYVGDDNVDLNDNNEITITEETIDD